MSELKVTQAQLEAALATTMSAYSQLVATLHTERNYWQAVGSTNVRLQAQLVTAAAAHQAAINNGPALPDQVLDSPALSSGKLGAVLIGGRRAGCSQHC